MTYLVSDKVPESDLNKVTGKVGGFVSDLGGKLLKEEIWKRRKLAYPIKKQEFATYVTINFDLPANGMTPLERQLHLFPQVIRHLIIVKDYGTEELTLTAEEIVGAEAIEEVAGGERAFEAVEGETADSRELMSVRNDKEEEAAPAEEPSEEPTETKEEAKAKAPAETKETAPKKTRGTKKPETEADRLAKLDKELDDILNDEL